MTLGAAATMTIKRSTNSENAMSPGVRVRRRVRVRVGGTRRVQSGW